MEPTTTHLLTEALTKAAAAHHHYEVEIGGPHAEWQGWYADHIARTLAEDGYVLSRVGHAVSSRAPADRSTAPAAPRRQP